MHYAKFKPLRRRRSQAVVVFALSLCRIVYGNATSDAVEFHEFGYATDATQAVLDSPTSQLRQFSAPKDIVNASALSVWFLATLGAVPNTRIAI